MKKSLLHVTLVLSMLTALLGATAGAASKVTTDGAKTSSSAPLLYSTSGAKDWGN